MSKRKHKKEFTDYLKIQKNKKDALDSKIANQIIEFVSKTAPKD